MKSVFEYVDSLPGRSKVAGCLLMSLLLGVADYVTGDFSLSLFYLVPIAFASWFIGKKTALYIAVICGLELYVIDLLVAPGKVSIVSLRSWNALMEVCYLLLTAYLISVVRADIEASRQRTIELESLNYELSAFNYSVAHDLRQPLNVINSYCQAVKELYEDDLDERGKDFIQEIYDGSVRMDNLIEALLIFSSMRNVEPHCKMVDLCALAHEVVTMLKFNEPERQVDFRLAKRIQANADINLMRVVLENLLGNAWKYTGMQKDAIIEFGATEINRKKVYFVKDNGIGFEAKDNDKLFMPFQRLPGAEICRGFGIGLSTVERIIHRHGGKVWAEGKPGNGATFYFTLSDEEKPDIL